MRGAADHTSPKTADQEKKDRSRNSVDFLAFRSIESGWVKPGFRGENIFLIYLDAESFDKSAIASCTVVINCAGKMMVEFFSTDISAIVWRVRS